MACQDCKKNPFSPTKKEFWLGVGGLYLVGSTIFTTYHLIDKLITSLFY
jgi:hypothetical protein